MNHLALELPANFQEVVALQAVEKLAAQDLRRSGRIPKEVAIRLIGWDAQGVEFVEETKTVLLSRHGAGIVSKHKLAVEQEMILVHLERNNKETEIRIVGQIGSEDNSYTYGVAFLDPDLDFWNVEFPSAKDSEGSDRPMVLQCSVCGRREFMNPGTLESDIYAIHEGIFRDCKHCKNSTFWQQTFEGVSDVSGLAEPALVCPEPVRPPEPCPSAGRFEKKRAHPRIRVNFTACVRQPGSDDSIVFCENVSRGGLCFKSSQRFYEAARIEVAAPYSPGSPCILLPAQIVYVQELPEQGMFRCGVQYLQLAKDPLA